MEEQNFATDVTDEVTTASEVEGTEGETLTHEQDEQMNIYRRNKTSGVTENKFAQMVRTMLGRARRAL